MLEIRRVKEAIVTYGIYSPSIKQMLNSWSSCNCAYPYGLVEYGYHCFGGWATFTVENKVEGGGGWNKEAEPEA